MRIQKKGLLQCRLQTQWLRRKFKHWHPPAPNSARTPEPGRRLLARSWLLAAILVCMWPVAPLLAQHDDVSPGQMQSGSLLLRMKSGYVVATRINTDIRMDISGLIARVSVRQEFRNDGQEWVEGEYVFPLPDDAAVDRLRLHIGERFIEGEIREKKAARKEYEEARKQGRKASLVEQQRANLFTTSVANIRPGELVSVEIEYLQTVKYDDNNFSLRFPLTLTPRYIPGNPLPGRRGSGWSADSDQVPDASLITPPFVTRSRDHKVSLQVSLNAGMTLEFIASRYHAVDITENGEHYVVSLANPDAPMDHDLELVWRPMADQSPRALLFSESRGGLEHVLLMMVPPNDFDEGSARVARETIFIIDTSGSMHGTSIEQAKTALRLALDGLHAGDRFNVIQFNSVTHALHPTSVAADAANIRAAKDYLNGLAANGGTEMRPALMMALQAGENEELLRQIVFITDGSVGNEKDLFDLIESDLGSARLFTVGIGSAPNGLFMRKAAEAGRGTFTFISALHEVNEKMTRLFRKLERPQVTNVRLQWPDGVSATSYPETIPDLYDGESVLVSARLDNAGRSGDLLTISGDSPMGGWRAELGLSIATESPGVAARWARARIDDLTDRARRGADPDEARTSIVETALKHHLVSKHTSLVAVDKTPSRPAASQLRKEQVPNLLPYGQSQAAIIGFPATATNAGLHQLAGIVLLVLALLLMLGGRVRRVRARLV